MADPAIQTTIGRDWTGEAREHNRRWYRSVTPWGLLFSAGVCRASINDPRHHLGSYSPEKWRRLARVRIWQARRKRLMQGAVKT